MLQPQVLADTHALELEPIAGRQPLNWKLVASLLVADLAGAVEKLD